MVSPTLKFARWAMLGLGVVYGFAHNSSLASSEKRHQDYERLKATKLEKERAKLQAGQTGVVTDPASPAFDLEKVLLASEAGLLKA